ncbi:MAG: tetratricopeptide repeat protein [Acidobacteriota bacterium]|nr:tetratricopeptide repeat protein [Acidobacteriota bacterium]
MKKLVVILLLSTFVFWSPAPAQEEGSAVWQVTHFDITATPQPADRALSAVANLAARNVGNGAGTSFTFRINNKAGVKLVTVGGATANFRAVAEARGNLQRVTVTLPNSVAPGGSTNLSISYSLSVENNTGLAAISPLASQFLPQSFWYPAPNTPFTVRGSDTAPFRLTINGANAISSGVEKSGSGSSVYEQGLNAQPFFVQGEWERIDGSGDVKDVSALVPKGASAEERRQAESIMSLVASARAFYAAMLGPAPAAPIRIVSVRRGSGFNEAGTVLLEAGAFRRAKIDSATAMLLSEAVARLWIGGQTAVRGEGSGVIRDGLVRFLTTLFIEKQFGREALTAELLRQRLAFGAVAKRDAPLSRSTPLDDTYFNSVPNRGAMLWRLADRRVGREIFMALVREQLQAGKDNLNGLSLAALRAALVQRGGEKLKTLLDQQIDQVIDMDLLIGLPQQRGAEWVSALRNLGSSDALVTVTATTDRGEQLSVEVTVPARNFADATFKTTAKLVRAEIDPEKLYPQLDYANDSAPRSRDIGEAIAEATRFFGAQDFTKAESVAREILAVHPRMQEALIILARALLAQNRNDEAEKLFRMALNELLPTPGAIAWANIGLGEISLKRGQAAEAAKRFNDAVRSDADYASSLTARAARIRAESAAGAPPVDESVRAFVKQLDQAITSGKKVELESRIVPGELVRFVGGIVGSQPEIWQTTVFRTEPLDSNLVAVDVSINAKELGQQQSGTAVLILSRAGGGWKLTGIELFEVR